MAKQTDKQSDEDVKILRELRDRFKRCDAWESTARKRFTEDIKFCEADSDNMYQWPDDVRNRLVEAKRVMLTINKTKQHVHDILNDARQAKVAIKIRATGGGSSPESAQVYMGVVRHIEYISNAGTAYQTGLSFAVRGGIGYWRVVTDFANSDSFDQEIFIRRIPEPKTVYLDPNINEFDGSDARFGIIFQDDPREESDKTSEEDKSVNFGPESWVMEKTIRSAEYFRRIDTTELLLAYPDPEAEGEEKVVRESELAPTLVKALLKMPTTKKRRVKTHKIEWFKVRGDKIVERRDWPGIYIPIVRCIGEETVIDGQLDRKGHVRALKDPQRMFNYNAAGAIEFGALQSRTPYIGPADAIEGFETFWNNSNVENYGYLPFNHMDDDGQAIPPPARQQPPVGAPVCMEGMNAAAEQMRMVSGQYQSDMGAPSNERSGAAITARQRQGDNATFHYLDHQSIAIRFTGKILIDLIPKIYDTERVFQIVDENGNEMQVKVDPNAKQAMQETDKTREQVALIFNPSVGRYEVEADVGPAFQTQRQEAWNAGVQILTQNKELVGIIGDLVFKMADFPGADEIAERLKRMVPAQALGDGPSPDLMAAQQQIESLKNFLQQVTMKLADKMADHVNNEEKNAISAYDAQTKRLNALKDALVTDPEGLVMLVKQVLLEAQATSEASLAPALDVGQGPTPEDAAAAVAPQPPAGLPAPGGPAPGEMMAPEGGPSMAPEDMGAGPAAAPGAAPVAPGL